MGPQQPSIFETIINNVNFPVILVDRQLVLRFANSGARAFFGIDSIKGSSYNFANFVQKGSLYSANAICTNGFKGIKTHKARVAFRSNGSKENNVKYGFVSATPLLENSKVKHLQIVVSDITDFVSVDGLRRRYFQSLETEIDSKEQYSKEILRASVLAIAALAESIDKYTYAHLQRIRHYSRLIAETMRENEKYYDLITDEYIELIYELSPLHDLGKVAIRDSVLQKKGKLTPDEIKIMQEHTNIGANALKMAGDLSNRPEAFAIAEMVARFHHERWDGTGYPAVKIDGEFRPLKGGETPLCARIVAFADVFDALTSERPYKKPYPFELAKKMVMEQSGKHFDPEVIDVFLRREEDFIKIRKQYPDREGEEQQIKIPNEFEMAERDKEYKELLHKTTKIKLTN